VTTRSLQSICRKWVNRLDLNHWTITIRFARQVEMGGNENDFYFGDCIPDLATRTATIRVANERNITDDLLVEVQKRLPGCSRRDAIEMSIIHELLHVLQDPTRQLARDALFENSLDVIATILMRFRDHV
jgi:hypothetical protein